MGESIVFVCVIYRNTSRTLIDALSVCVCLYMRLFMKNIAEGRISLPMDFQYDTMALRTAGAIFIEFILWLRAPPESPRQVRLKCYFHLAARRWREGVISMQGKISSKIGKYREMRRQTDDKALKISEEEWNWSIAKLSRQISRGAFGVKSSYLVATFMICIFFDRTCCFHLNAGRWRGDTILLQRKTSSNIERILRNVMVKR